MKSEAIWFVFETELECVVRGDHATVCWGERELDGDTARQRDAEEAAGGEKGDVACSGREENTFNAATSGRLF